MYESYFGLTERPFSIAPDPQYLYMSSRHKEAMGHLSYGLQQGGCFIVLTGEVGTGKTTLCRNLLSDLPENVDVALILNANINEQELLQTICDEFGIQYQQDTTQKQLLDSINAYLLETFSENRHAVLIIDEAQLLSRDVLEQIRLLTNLETTKSKLLQIILIGQPELNDLLTRNDLRQLAQRVTARYHLGALQRNEIEDYVNFRLGVAGCKKPVFSRQALNKLHALTEGIPRKINVLADHCLLAAYSKNQAVVDAKTVKSAAGDVFIENGPSAQSALKKSRWKNIAAVAAALALFNIGLWWFFTQPSNDATKATQTVAAVEATPASQTEPEVVTEQAQEPTPIIETPTKTSTQTLSYEDQPLTAVNVGEVKPGSVVISEQPLDDSDELPAEAVAAINSGSDQPAAQVVQSAESQVAPSQLQNKAQPPVNNVIDDGAFARLLETSADLTGRIAAFRELAKAWDAVLPDQLMQPACDTLQSYDLQCLYVTSWQKLLNYNRPAVLVVSHQDQLHRILLTDINGDQAQVLVGGRSQTVDLTELQARWTQEAMILTRPSPLGERILQLGDKGRPVANARKQLAKALEIARIPTLKAPSSTTYDLDMGQKVFALQSRFGISRDSRIGNETNLLMNEMISPDTTPVLRNRLQ